MHPFRVGVLDEHEIFRRGLTACIADDALLTVAQNSASGPVDPELDVAVASPAIAAEHGFPCPLVVPTSERRHVPAFRERNPAAVALSRVDLTSELLVATVRAVAAGLRATGAGEQSDPLDQRERRLLQLLADGADTRHIARSMSYSERTIKGMIRRVERELGASSRAQAVAKSIRQGII